MIRKFVITIEKKPDSPITACCEPMQFEINTNRITFRNGNEAYINAGGYNPPKKLNYCPYCGERISITDVLEPVFIPMFQYFIEDDNEFRLVKSIGVTT